MVQKKPAAATAGKKRPAQALWGTLNLHLCCASVKDYFQHDFAWNRKKETLNGSWLGRGHSLSLERMNIVFTSVYMEKGKCLDTTLSQD
eukprot:3101221-Amphidinium_carterae.1